MDRLFEYIAYLLTFCSLILLACLVLFKKPIESKQEEKKGVVVICSKCKGTGETEQDVNLLLAEASFAIWYNLHVTPNKCEVCSKNKLCDVAQKKYDVIIEKYKKIGPNIEKAICPSCMGAGTYTQYKGYRFSPSEK